VCKVGIRIRHTENMRDTKKDVGRMMSLSHFLTINHRTGIQGVFFKYHYVKRRTLSMTLQNKPYSSVLFDRVRARDSSRPFNSDVTGVCMCPSCTSRHQLDG